MPGQFFFFSQKLRFKKKEVTVLCWYRDSIRHMSDTPTHNLAVLVLANTQCPLVASNLPYNYSEGQAFELLNNVKLRLWFYTNRYLNGQTKKIMFSVCVQRFAM